MGRIFFIIAALLFLFAALNITIVRQPTAWALFLVAVGLAVGGIGWTPWKRTP